ncbi:MAG: hypothetical protein KGL35_10955 [Bradyrhizobium sp.]|nr:hypothetical protein [Bradyrhizobium sp.]
MPVGFQDYSIDSFSQLQGHITTGLTLGQLEDPYVLSVVADYTAGTIPAGTYHVGVTTADSTGESWTGNYTVTLTAPGQIIIKWVPVWGGDHYNVYVGPTLATASRQATVAGAATNTCTVTSYTPNASIAPLTNSSAGELQANVICTSTVEGGPANFFLNLGTTTNSASSFFFTNAEGIVAIFQNKGKAELDIALKNTGEVQFYCVGNHEIDFFIDNTLACNFQSALCDFVVNVQLATPSVATALINYASPVLALINSWWNGSAAVANEWKLVCNTSNQIEFDYNSTERMFLDSTGLLYVSSAAVIGTVTAANPYDILTLHNPSSHCYLRIDAPLADQSSLAFGDDTNGQDCLIYRPQGTRDLSIYTVTAGVVLYVPQAGNVGLGTTNPQQSLEISNSAPFQLRVGTGATSAAGTYDIGRNMSTGFLNFYGNQTGFVGYVFGGVDGTFVTILDSGHVGIGTTTPKSKLDVIGLPIYGNNAAAITGGLAAGSFYRTGADPDPVCVVH